MLTSSPSVPESLYVIHSLIVGMLHLDSGFQQSLHNLHADLIDRFLPCRLKRVQASSQPIFFELPLPLLKLFYSYPSHH